MTPSRRARPIALAVVAGLTLTGCAAGVNAQTNQRRTYSEGANEIWPNGQLLLRNFYLAPPPQELGVWPEGSDVPAYGVFANQGDFDDQLVSVDSPLATDVTIWSGGDPLVGIAEHTSSFLEVYQPDRPARPGGTDTRRLPGPEGEEVGGGFDPDDTEGFALDDAMQLDSLPLPVGDKLEVLPGTGFFLLEDVVDEIYPGTTIPMTITFEESGSLTFRAYVHTLGERFERESVVEEEAEGTESGSATDVEAGVE